MVDDDIVKTVIDAFATSPRGVTHFPHSLVLYVRVAGVTHLFYQYVWAPGTRVRSGSLVPGLYCESRDGFLPARLSDTALIVDRVDTSAVPAVLVTCMFCLHEDHRLGVGGF